MHSGTTRGTPSTSMLAPRPLTVSTPCLPSAPTAADSRQPLRRRAWRRSSSSRCAPTAARGWCTTSTSRRTAAAPLSLWRADAPTTTSSRWARRSQRAATACSWCGCAWRSPTPAASAWPTTWARGWHDL